MCTTPDSAYAVQAMLSLPLLVIGLSHIFRPKIWIAFFSYLHGLGAPGVILRTFGLELLPAMVITTFHWVWSGPEILLSLYGVLLGAKITISLLAPSVGLASLSMADRHGEAPLRLAGALLVLLSCICFWALVG